MVNLKMHLLELWRRLFLILSSSPVSFVESVSITLFISYIFSNVCRIDAILRHPGPAIVWLNVWHLFLWVWVSASQKISLSVLTRNPHKGLAHEISYETGRRRRKAKSKKEAEQSSRQKRIVKRREQELGPVDLEAGLAYVRGWVSVPGGFVGISFEYTLAIAHRCTESYTKVS